MLDWRRHALSLLEQQGVPAAYNQLVEAVGQGNATAALCLAEWRLTGQLIRRDLSESRKYYGIAAKLLPEARGRYVALLANGAGDIGRKWSDAISILEEDPSPDALAQISLLEKMAIDGDGNPTALPSPQHPLDTAEISIFRNFVSPSEAEYLCSIARPKLARAMVVHPQTNQLIADPIRRSSSTAFTFVEEKPVVHAINRRIAHATGTSYENGEPLQVLSYDPGDEYKLHLDTLPYPKNQRQFTLLVYLTEDYEGGETTFPHLDWSFKGSVGDALLFRNLDAANLPNPSMAHFGGSVRAGRKMILSKWIRISPLDLSGPSNRPF